MKQTTPQDPLPWLDAKLMQLGDDRLTLVPLGAIVRWLMKSRQLAFVPAVHDLHCVLSRCQRLRLYCVAPSGVAVLVKDQTFDLLLKPRGRRVISPGLKATGVMGRPAPTPSPKLPDGVTPGLSAALHAIRHRWGNGHYTEACLDEPWEMNTLAVEAVQAHILWGEAVEPPQGWEIEGEFGFMAYGADSASRLVRLVDVLRWLQTSRQLPLKPATDALCEAMPHSIMAWLYKLHPTDYAQLVREDEAFGFKTADQIERDKAQSLQRRLQQDMEDRQGLGWSFARGGEGSAPVAPPKWPDPTEPGRPALLKRIRQDFGGYTLNGNTLALLAIPMTVAHGACGYGHTDEGLTVLESPRVLESYAELVEFRKNHKDAKWSHRMKELLDKEKERLKSLPGQKGVSKTLGGQLGVSDRRVDELIREYKEECRLRHS